MYVDVRWVRAGLVLSAGRRLQGDPKRIRMHANCVRGSQLTIACRAWYEQGMLDEIARCTP